MYVSAYVSDIYIPRNSQKIEVAKQRYYIQKKLNLQIVKPYNSDLEVNILISGDFYCSFICDSFVRDDSPANTSTLIFGWKWKLSRRTLIEVVSTLAKQSWSNVDRITLIQCWWLNVNSTLIFGWKRKLSQSMFISLAST